MRLFCFIFLIFNIIPDNKRRQTTTVGHKRKFFRFQQAPRSRSRLLLAITAVLVCPMSLQIAELDKLTKVSFGSGGIEFVIHVYVILLFYHPKQLLYLRHNHAAPPYCR